jgi:hypothetical protein
VVNYGLDTTGTEMALLAREGEDGRIKFSLRAKEPRRIDDVAQAFGGGGHPQASGITMEGTLDAAVEQVLLEMETMLHKQKRLTAPQSAGDPITIEYAKNCQMYDYIVCLADLLSGGTEQERQDCVTYLMGGMLARFKRASQKGEITDDDVF